MKNFLNILFLVAVIFISAQEGIKFEKNKFSEILAKAKKENKLVFIDSYTSWCGPCKLMEKNIFPLQSVGDYYNSNFINTKFDMEKGEGIAIAKKYKINLYPTYLFLDGDGRIIHSSSSYMEEKDFIQLGKDALDPTTQIVTLKARFEKGEKDPEFLKKLAELSNDPVVLARYYTVNPNITKSEISDLVQNISGTDDILYKVFKSKKPAFLKLISEQEYDDFDQNIKITGVYKKAYNWANHTLDEKYYLNKMQQLVGKENAGKMLLDLKATIAIEKKDYKSYEKIVSDKYKDFSNTEPSDLSMTAYIIAESGITDKLFLEKAIQWALQSNSKMPMSITMLTLAKLYHKINDQNNAKTWAEKALETEKSSDGQNPDFMYQIQEFLGKLR